MQGQQESKDNAENIVENSEKNKLREVTKWCQFKNHLKKHF